MMSRMTCVAAISNLRRINTPINREGKAPKPRQLHYTSWGIVCPVETPEGGSCGLVKNLAMMRHVRIGTYSGAIKEQLLRIKEPELIPLLTCSDKIRANGIPIIVNGTLYMYVKNDIDAKKSSDTFKRFASKVMIPFDASLSFVDRTICIDTDPGCFAKTSICCKQITSC